ncbi:Bifunctional protein GlmU [BD1-7 clade bacterium]|uniref:Bifunctional protein GlmU n=1 Tax=BD1-7 clade bacterium TaxID=2029982 RepID=A0A5S9N0K7_9GAMM|nr:Bifunctional protein GlmU [BD1-7 clade bacterium]CAA0083121.1 Bifunctional protein GlmU [BD1-7 clade bacterium]
MKSHLPKVLQPLAGRPLLSHVIDSCSVLPGAQLHIVVGHKAEQVRSTIEQELQNPPVMHWVEQTEQLGTGHAVQQALPGLSDDGIALLLCGDVPLISATTLLELFDKVSNTNMALLTIELDNPFGFGRIVRDDNGHVCKIVEQKDANEAIQAIGEINTGMMAIKTSHLKQLLPQISNDNAQHEYYLTDLISLCVENGIGVEAVQTNDEIEVMGINDKVQLASLERAYQYRQAEALMREGVTMADPSRFDLRGKLTVGMDVFIDVNCVFEGQVELQDGVTIGANCIIGSPGEQVTIKAGTEIKPNSMVEAAHIDENCTVGPYARLRPGTVLKSGAKIGNFVETKKSVVGKGSKVNHLTYVGDTQIGESANIGAGTITCNYDGVNKSATIIGDNAFIGSNSSLVAPVEIGAGATVGAGSTITQSIEDGALAVARGRQKNIPNWPRPRKK